MTKLQRKRARLVAILLEIRDLDLDVYRELLVELRQGAIVSRARSKGPN